MLIAAIAVAAAGLALGAADMGTTLHTGQGLLTVLDRQGGTAAEMLESMTASGYVTGTADTLHFLHSTCQPPGTTNGQNVAVVVNYLKAHPKLWQEDSTELMFAALTNAWPCDKP